MAATLAMLKNSGDLNFRDSAREEKFGRTKDVKLQQAKIEDYQVL
jgi:hypothetical protein